jgi:hypothetical protein
MVLRSMLVRFPLIVIDDSSSRHKNLDAVGTHSTLLGALPSNKGSIMRHMPVPFAPEARPQPTAPPVRRDVAPLPRCVRLGGWDPVVFLSLDHRLIAVMPSASRVDRSSFHLSTKPTISIRGWMAISALTRDLLHSAVLCAFRVENRLRVRVGSWLARLRPVVQPEPRGHPHMRHLQTFRQDEILIGFALFAP